MAARLPAPATQINDHNHLPAPLLNDYHHVDENVLNYIGFNDEDVLDGDGHDDQDVSDDLLDNCSVDSHESGPVGQMTQGFVDLEEDQLDADFEGALEVLSDGLQEDLEIEPQVDGFDYKNPVGEPFSRQELLSFAFNDIALKFKFARQGSSETMELFGYVLPKEIKPLDYRTARKRIMARTGINEVLYDCCPESHMSFALYPELDACIECGHQRWKVDGTGTAGQPRKVPYATHSYIPLAHRLSLMYANDVLAGRMISYRRAAEQDRQRGIRSDYWSSDHFQDMKAKGFFAADTDLAFMLSTDGVKVFKSRRSFSIWPILLVLSP